MPAAALAAVMGCQAILGLEEGKPRPEGQDGSAASSASASMPSSSSAAGGGDGGAGGTGGAGGIGGAGGGCPNCPIVLLLGGGASAATIVTGAFRPDSGWTTDKQSGISPDRPALTITPEGTGVGLLRIGPAGMDGALEYVTWKPGAGWSPLAVVGSGLLKIRSEPSISAADKGAHAAYQREDYKYMFAAFVSGAWSPPDEAVSVSGKHTFGPSAPHIAALGADSIIAFIHGDDPAAAVNHLFVQRRTGGAWIADEDLASDTDFDVPPPRIVRLLPSEDLLVVYVRKSDQQIRYRLWDGTAWQAAASVANATTTTRPDLCALPGDGAVLAYKGIDNKLYTARFEMGAWADPSAIGNPSVDVKSPPAVAPGVDGAEVELAYLPAGEDTAYHVRYVGGSYSAPVAIATEPGLTNLVLASRP
jgi:hypothetical protein